MSRYHFQRMFHAVTGFTVAEYIRNRRLTLAGDELTRREAKVISVAMKYGYDSPDAFAKAFQRLHGIHYDFQEDGRMPDGLLFKSCGAGYMKSGLLHRALNRLKDLV